MADLNNPSHQDSIDEFPLIEQNSVESMKVYYDSADFSDFKDAFDSLDSTNQHKFNEIIKKYGDHPEVKKYFTDDPPYEVEDLIYFFEVTDAIEEQNKNKEKEEIVEEKEEIVEEKEEIVEEKEEIVEEKEEIVEEKEEIVEEKEENNKSEIKKLLQKESIISYFSEKKIDLSKVTIDVIKEHYVGLLKAAKLAGSKEFIQVYNSLKKIENNSGTAFLLDKELNEYYVSLTQIKSKNSTEDITNTLSSSGFSVSLGGDELSFKDELIDMGKEPPVKYITSENGYRLESSVLDYRVDRKLAREMRRLEKSITVLEGERQGILNEGLKVFRSDFTKPSNLNNVSAIIAGTQGLEGKSDIQQKIEEFDDFLENPTGDIDVKAKMLKDFVLEALKRHTNKKKVEIQKQSLLLEEKKQEEEKNYAEYKRGILEKDERSRKIVQDLTRVGFDMIPKGVSDKIIGILNSNTGMRESLGFNSEIDLENGNLGINLDGDINEVTQVEVEKFAKFVNIMISGTEDIPIDNVPSYGRPSLKDANGNVMSDTDLPGYMNRMLGSIPDAKVLSNIDEYILSKGVVDDQSSEPAVK